MKNLLLMLLLITLGVSCNKDEVKDPFEGEDLTASKTIGKPGNYWNGSIRGLEGSVKGTIISNEDGVTDIEVEIGGLGSMVQEIKLFGEDITTDGKIEMRAKFSTNTIATFDYGSTSNENPFVLVKFDGSTGDKYTHTVNGKEFVREITDDNFEIEALGLIIKTIAVEETIPAGALTIKLNGEEFDVTKIRYLVNHRFGLLVTFIYINEGLPIMTWDATETNCDTK